MLQNLIRPALTLAVVLLAAAWAVQAGDEASKPLPDDLSGFRHVGSLAVTREASPIHGFHHFYVNETGLEVFRSEPPLEYPEGTHIVGKVFAVKTTEDGRVQDGDLLAYTSMRKAADDPAAQATGGWLFRQFDAEGRDMEVAPKQACWSCHEPHEKTDFVLSRPLGGR